VVLAAATAAVLACAGNRPRNGEGVEETPAADTVADPCRTPPLPLEGRDENGRPLISARALPDRPETSEWTYYDRQGRRTLVELRDRDGNLEHLTAYYPNGNVRFAGPLFLDTGAGVFRSAGQWELLFDDGATHARAVMQSGALDHGLAWQWDRYTREVEWSLAENVFTYEQQRTVVSQPWSYPEDLARKGIGGLVCSLVCIDAEGELAGVFLTKRDLPGFDEAVTETLKFWRFAPRKLGDIALPSCETKSAEFKPF
jgi:hypothetical protein